MVQNQGTTQTQSLTNLTPVQQEAITMLVEHSPPSDGFWQSFANNLEAVFNGTVPSIIIEKRGQYLAVNKSSDSGQSRR